MGRIVGAFGMSHVVFSPLGVERQAETVIKGMLDVRRHLRALRPDVMVFAGGDHFNNFNLALQVPIAVGISDSFRTLGDGGVPVTEFAGNRDFAEGMARFAGLRDFDIVQAEEIVPDHGMAFPKLVVDPANAVPTVPLYINSAMPLPPSPRRCYRLGEILRAYVEQERPEAERVVVIGLGGLSHWLRMPGEGRIATDFDLGFLEALEMGGAEAFSARNSSADIVEAAGNGGLELLAWLVAAGATGDQGGSCLFYEAVEPWITGIAAIELFAGATSQKG